MNSSQKNAARRMREDGKSYAQIAVALSLSENTIKSFCRREGLQAATGQALCPACGKAVRPGQRGQKRRFCSDACRFAWNYTHRVLDAHNAVARRCACCRREFFSYPSAHRKYCSHACYIADRYGKGACRHAGE